MAPKYPMNDLQKENLLDKGYTLLIKLSYSLYQIQQEKHLLQEL